MAAVSCKGGFKAKDSAFEIYLRNQKQFLKYIEFGCNILRSPCINMAKGRKGETKC